MPRANSQAGSAPIKNGSGAAATASAAGDSCRAARAGRCDARSSGDRLACDAQVVGANADHSRPWFAGPCAGDERQRVAQQARWRDDRWRRCDDLKIVPPR